MRLKLVMAASALAAVLGAGSCIAILMATFSSLKPITRPGLMVLVTFLLPTAAVVMASIFVYRHTARRRKLQALLTAVLATLLSLCLFMLASILSSYKAPRQPMQQGGPYIAS
ncbi:MAG: hypothetical protein ABR555_04595 [Pyrinomonadaceae bacterium]